MNIPPKPNPEMLDWLISGSIDTDAVRDVLISVAFWKLIDETTHIKALARIKKGQGWYDNNKGDTDALKGYHKAKDHAHVMIERAFTEEPFTLARMLARAADMSFNGIETVGDSVEQIQTQLAVFLEDNRLFRYLEVDSADEYILQKIMESERDPEDPDYHSHRRKFQDSRFMLTYLLPTLRANGIDKKLVLGIKDNWSKARISLPFIRTILDDVINSANEILAAKEETQDKEELDSLNRAYDEVFKVDTRLKDILETLMTELVKPVDEGGYTKSQWSIKMKSIAMAGKANTSISNNGNKRFDKYMGWVYNTKKGGILMLTIEETKDLNRLMKATGGLVDWHLGRIEDMSLEVIKMVARKDLPPEIEELLKK